MPKYVVNKNEFYFESRTWHRGDEFDALDTIEIRTHKALGNISDAVAVAMPKAVEPAKVPAPVAPETAKDLTEAADDQSLFNEAASATPVSDEEAQASKPSRRQYRRRDLQAEE